MLLVAAVFAVLQQPIVGAPISEPRKVAVLPWTMEDGTPEAEDTTRQAIGKIFDFTKYDLVGNNLVKDTWENTMNEKPILESMEGNKPMPPLPKETELLALGQALNVDLVCAGRAKFHTKSVWISLGPKTKADCTVDLMIIDVKTKTVLLDAKDVRADDTKVESTLETAGALFVAFGITAFSGGPKTPHQKKAGVNAVAKAFDPWVKTIAPSQRKIGG